MSSTMLSDEYTLPREQATSSRDVWMCGKQRFWMEAPDLLRMELHGTFETQEAEGYLRLVYELGDRFGTFSLLADLRDAGHISVATRSTLSRVARPYPYRAVVTYGASFTVRILGTMIVNAGRTLARSAFPFKLAFFQTEPEARVYLTAFRDQPPRAP
jgi:hypothetical protein